MPHFPTARLALAALTLPALLASCGGGGGSSSGSTTTTPAVVTGTTTTSNDPTVVPTAAEQAMIKAVNVARSTSHYCALDPVFAADGQKHLPAGTYAATTPVVWNASLMKAARSYANFMATNKIAPEKLGHELDGMTEQKRDMTFGYSSNINDFDAAENVAENYSNTATDIQAVIDAWLLSTDGHCQAIMNPTFKEFGAGYAEAYLPTTVTKVPNPTSTSISYTSTNTYNYWVQEFGAR